MPDSHYAQLTFNFDGFSSHRGLLPGLFGILTEGDSIELGADIDLLVLARRTKAVDTAINLTTYDIESAESQRIIKRRHTEDTTCFTGMSFLVYEHSSDEFLEWFCGPKLSKTAIRFRCGYTPISKAEVLRLGLSCAPRDAQWITVRSRPTQERDFFWYTPHVELCGVHLTARPSADEITREVERFTSEKDHI